MSEERQWIFYYFYNGKVYEIKVTKDNEAQVAQIILDTPKQSRTKIKTT